MLESLLAKLNWLFAYNVTSSVSLIFALICLTNIDYPTEYIIITIKTTAQSLNNNLSTLSNSPDKSTFDFKFTFLL